MRNKVETVLMSSYYGGTITQTRDFEDAMAGLILFITGRSEIIECKGTSIQVPQDSLAFTETCARIKLPLENATFSFHYSAGDLQSLRKDLLDIPVADQFASLFIREKIKWVSLPEGLPQIMSQIGRIKPDGLLRFAYSYCLGVDPMYFTMLLRSLTDGCVDLLEYVQDNCLNGWSVIEFARHLDIPARKLNVIFYEKYGVSAKKWLLEQRLKHARQLLLLTTMRVTDIAQECGFSSHAHFSDSFRKFYKACPRKVRRGEMHGNHF